MKFFHLMLCPWICSSVSWFIVFGNLNRVCILLLCKRASLVARMVKRLPAMWETWVWSLGQEYLLEKEMATHFSTLAWKIPWMEEPGRLQPMGLQRVGHDWATSPSFSIVPFGEGNGNPLQCPCLENPMDGGAWWATVYGVAKSWTRLSN